jgi:hypothetical protein
MKLAKRRHIQLPSSVHDPCAFALAASWGVGTVVRPNSLLSVLVRNTRHLIFYTLESVGEALGEQPHLTGGSKTKPGGKRVAHTSLATNVEDEEGCQSDQVDFSTAPAGSIPNSK